MQVHHALSTLLFGQIKSTLRVSKVVPWKLLSQEKLTKIACNFGKRPTGGSTQDNLCHSVDATKLISSILPRKDICAWIRFHLLNLLISFQQFPPISSDVQLPDQGILTNI